MRVAIQVRPGARRPGVGGSYDGALVVRVREPAVDQRATEAALVAVAAALDVPRAQVTLAAGARSRRKIVVVDNPPAGAEERLAQLLDR